MPRCSQAMAPARSPSAAWAVAKVKAGTYSRFARRSRSRSMARAAAVSPAAAEAATWGAATEFWYPPSSCDRARGTTASRARPCWSWVWAQDEQTLGEIRVQSEHLARGRLRLRVAALQEIDPGQLAAGLQRERVEPMGFTHFPFGLR